VLTLIDSGHGQPSVLRDQKIKNFYYGLNYFNTLASLWRRAHENHETNNIIMYENDSTVMALKNSLNGSHEIITLRELLVKRGIQIYLANRDEWSRLIAQLFKPNPSNHHQDQ